MAILPLKLRPRMTSLAVVEAPKPEPMGVCWVNRRNLLEHVRKAWFNLSELYLTVRTVTPCHPERSEGSDSPGTEILRCAQDDSIVCGLGGRTVFSWKVSLAHQMKDRKTPGIQRL